MLSIIFFYFSFVICEDENEVQPSTSDLPFDLIDLHMDWDILFSHSSGQFSDEQTRFQFSPKITMSIYKVNGSVKIQTTALQHMARLYHANITGNKIELFAQDLSLIATMNAYKLDNQTVTIRGSSLDGVYTIFGYMSPFQKSLITVTSTNSDDVYTFRGIPPHIITASEIFVRILPSIAIVFFMGFGRIYRARFWRQYSQMNTRTLQNRINKASSQNKK